MLRMLQAHGLDAGPTQRPLLAGAAAGAVAAVPAIAVLVPFGSLDALSQSAGASPVIASLACGALMTAGGVLYGWLFRRAANDPRGGWLFGLSFGFVLWMVGPIPLLQWLPKQPILLGYPSAGLLLGQLLWGLVLGAVFPVVHRRFHVTLDDGSSAGSRRAGPEAAAQTKLLHSLPSSKRTS